MSPPAAQAAMPTDEVHAARVCEYCHLPVASAGVADDAPVYCCLGCRLAAEITGKGGPQGAVHGRLARLGLAIFLSLNVMIFTMALWTQDVTTPGSGASPLADLAGRPVSLPVPGAESARAVPAGWAHARKRAGRLATRRMMTDLLIVVGVAAAYVYSAISVVRGTGHVYFEVGCIVLVMVTLGRWLESSGKLKTTEALDALSKLLPEQVRVIASDAS